MKPKKIFLLLIFLTNNAISADMTHQMRCEELFMVSLITKSGSPNFNYNLRGKPQDAKEIKPIKKDKRFFLMQLVPRDERSQNRPEMDINIFRSLEPRFTYLNTLYYREGSHYFFEADDGVQFTIPRGSFDNIWKDPTVRKQKLMDYLGSVHSIVKTGDTDPNLDSFFNRIHENTQSKYSGFGFSQEFQKLIPESEFLIGPLDGTLLHKVFVKKTRVSENVIIERYDTELRSNIEVILPEENGHVVMHS